MHYAETRSPIATRKKRKMHLLAQHVHFPQNNMLANTSTSTLMEQIGSCTEPQKNKKQLVGEAVNQLIN